MKTITKAIYDNLELLPLDLQGWNGDDPMFGKIIEEFRPAQIIEVGTWKGQSAITMGKKVRELGLDCKITCVDTWLGATEFWTDLADTYGRNLNEKNGYPQVYYQFASNVVHSGLQDIILPVTLDSRNACRYLSAKGVVADMIYLDGSHVYEDVLWELNNYWKLLRPGGIVLGDDYGIGVFGVKQAVDEFVAVNGLTVEFNGGASVLWMIKKPF